MTIAINTSRTHILSLYRNIHKTANKLPKDFQRIFIIEKARCMFREPKKDAEELEHSVRLAMVHLDDIEAQVKALNTMYTDDRKSFEQLDQERLQKQIMYHAQEKPDWAHDEDD